MSDWNATICANCWPAYIAGSNRDQFVKPVRMMEADEEICFSCGRATTDGIYIRVHPVMQEAIVQWRTER